MVQIHKSLFRVCHWSTQIHGTGLCTYSLEQCHAYCFNSFNSVKVARNLWGCVEWASHYQLLQNRHYLVHPYNSFQDYPNFFSQNLYLLGYSRLFLPSQNSWTLQNCFSQLRTPGLFQIISPNAELPGYPKLFPWTQNSWDIQNHFPQLRTPGLSKFICLNLAPFFYLLSLGSSNSRTKERLPDQSSWSAIGPTPRI